MPNMTLLGGNGLAPSQRPSQWKKPSSLPDFSSTVPDGTLLLSLASPYYDVVCPRHEQSQPTHTILDTSPFYPYALADIRTVRTSYCPKAATHLHRRYSRSGPGSRTARLDASVASGAHLFVSSRKPIRGRCRAMACRSCHSICTRRSCPRRQPAPRRGECLVPSAGTSPGQPWGTAGRRRAALA